MASFRPSYLPINNFPITHRSPDIFENFILQLYTYFRLPTLTQFKMDPTIFSLTFGVELEFIVRYNPEDYEGKRLKAEGKIWTDDLDGILVQMDMIETLNDNGFPTNSYKETDFLKWTVDTDGTVSASGIKGSWHAIEVKTPVLSSCRASLDLIDRVLKLLVSKFKIFTNEKCGLHVHVGNEDRGFDLSTLKTFCSLITAFDSQLESLHPPSRVKNPYAKGTETLFHHGATLIEKLSIIERLETEENLITQFHLTEDSNDKYMAYNFLNLQLDPDRGAEPLRTIEFRQHRGTLDPKLITNWVTVVCGLIKKSYTDKGDIRELIETSRLHNPKYPVRSLLEELQLGEQAKFYMDQNPSAVDDSIVEEESAWEKEFAPRPSYEQTAGWEKTTWEGQFGSISVEDIEAWSLSAPESADSGKDADFW